MDWSSVIQMVKMCLIGKCFFIKPWSECRTQGPVYSLFVHFLSRFWAMAQNPDPCVQYLNCKSHMITWTPVFKLILILALRYSITVIYFWTQYIKFHKNKTQISHPQILAAKQNTICWISGSLSFKQLLIYC